MAETIVRGYIAKIQDYKTFDAIIVIVSEDDRILPCLALGVKKSLSKNARQLLVGNYNESSIFLATLGRISKLKKTICLDQINLQCYHYFSFNLLNNFVGNLNGYVFNVFNFYNQIINQIKDNSCSDFYLSLLTIVRIIKFLGIKFVYQRCVICTSKKNIKTIDFSNGGFICEWCFKNKQIAVFDKKILVTIYNLFKNDSAADVAINSIWEYRHLFKQFLKMIDVQGGINLTRVLTDS